LGSFLLLLGRWLFLPGASNKPRLEYAALGDLFHFGKWVFLSTAAGFVIQQADRALLGLWIPIDALGVYHIGLLLASVPLLLQRSLQSKVVTPLYRMKDVRSDRSNRKALFRARRLLALFTLSATAILAFIGPDLVRLLYDARYVEAGAVITLFCFSAVPILCLNTVNQALLGMGDSRRACFTIGLRALLQTVFLIIGFQLAGIAGVILAAGLATLVAYPLMLTYARHYDVWDPLQDFGLTSLGLALCGAACWLHADILLPLFEV
ncbi:MAG: oligosaccharide flippase family protein, partial [Pseudomonadota bacterium]